MCHSIFVCLSVCIGICLFQIRMHICMTVTHTMALSLWFGFMSVSFCLFVCLRLSLTRTHARTQMHTLSLFFTSQAFTSLLSLSLSMPVCLSVFLFVSLARYLLPLFWPYVLSERSV